jgi:hypothetical protein
MQCRWITFFWGIEWNNPLNIYFIL